MSASMFTAPAYSQMQMTPQTGNNANMAAHANAQSMGGMDMQPMMEMMQSMLNMMQAMQTGMQGGMMQGDMTQGGMMQGDMTQGNSAYSLPVGVGGSPLKEPGQSAFATIAEIVRVLNGDPDTDWSQVDIDTLRTHLQDMDRVTIDSEARAEEIQGGLRFIVTGDEKVSLSVERMIFGHAQTMNGVDGWTYTAQKIPGGASLDVLVPEQDLVKLKALGFYGMLGSGMHHQPHHWMMANGGGMGM